MVNWLAKLHNTIITITLLGLLALTACTPTQEDALINAATKVSSELDGVLTNAPQLAFAGKVASSDGSKWLNEYVAIVYKDGQEIGRDISKLGELPESGEGKHDGLFLVKIQNEYALTAADLTPPNTEPIFQDALGAVGVKYIYTWIDELAPGHQITYDVPAKRIQYTLIIIPQPLSDLPAEFQDSLTELTADNKIVVHPVTGDSFELMLETAVSPTPLSDDIPSAAANGVNWTRSVTGFYGSRWDGWVQYVEGQVTGITWEAFKEESLRHNPDLETDGYAFLAEKTYLFPEN